MFNMNSKNYKIWVGQYCLDITEINTYTLILCSLNLICFFKAILHIIISEIDDFQLFFYSLLGTTLKVRISNKYVALPIIFGSQLG